MVGRTLQGLVSAGPRGDKHGPQEREKSSDSLPLDRQGHCPPLGTNSVHMPRWPGVLVSCTLPTGADVAAAWGATRGGAQTTPDVTHMLYSQALGEMHHGGEDEGQVGRTPQLSDDGTIHQTT